MAILYAPVALFIGLLPSPKAAEESKQRIIRKRTMREYILVAIGAVILAVYVGAEVAFGGYIYSYFVRFLERSGSEGDFLTAVFWGALTVRMRQPRRAIVLKHPWQLGRLLAIPISVFLSARTMLIVNMFISAASICTIWATTGNVPVVWFSLGFHG